jgi:hypothetical protein
MNKAQFDNEFKMNDLEFIAKQYEQDGIPDKPARREAYNNKVDAYQKDGIITEEQAQNWCIPDSLETTKYWL